MQLEVNYIKVTSTIPQQFAVPDINDSHIIEELFGFPIMVMPR